MQVAYHEHTCERCGRKFERSWKSKRFCGLSTKRGTCAFLERGNLRKKSLNPSDANVIIDWSKIDPRVFQYGRRYPTCSCGRKYLPKLGCLWCTRGKQR